MAPLVLLLPDKPDVERDAVADAWVRAGGTVVKVARFWDPPEVDRASVRVYGNDSFCLVLAEKLGLELVSPSDDVLVHAPDHLLHRRVRIVLLGGVDARGFPLFVKPVSPKQFRGAVYPSTEALAEETRGLPPDTQVIVSEVVSIVAEARAFVLGPTVKTCAIYEGTGDVNQAAKFAERVVQALDLPRTCVVDVGLLSDGRWALVECNATWGAGLNGCDPERAIACIAEASGPR
ncbi:MAG: ATP-grasp domain-containing protein [Deltaproteobacteria bacterium]|nr:ATP-grasp domain-containing protein [Deltaproteobacteria bacterium]